MHLRFFLVVVVFKFLSNFFAGVLFCLLSACVTQVPTDVNNICSLFKQNPKWYAAAKEVEKRWRVPVPIQMAIIHQESRFNAKARPARNKVMKVVPWRRPSTSYGYTQALHSTWKVYKQNNGSVLASRSNFADGVDFIGWYANQATKVGVKPSDAYALYLAYHEGVGGYQRKTYLKKAWVMAVAKKVQARSALYAMQLKSCQGSLRSYSLFY